MCRTNTSDCELFSAVCEYEFCLLFLNYWDATWLLCRKQQWMHAYWISMPCQHCRTARTSKADWLIVVHAMSLPTEAVLTKQFQKACSHIAICIFVCFILKGHLCFVAGFLSKGKSFCPCSSICSNFTLFQFPTVCCEHCCNTFPFRWKKNNKLHSPLEIVTTGIQEIAGKKNAVAHIPSGQTQDWHSA